MLSWGLTEFAAAQAPNHSNTFYHDRWTLTHPSLFLPGAKGTFDEIAVKDPTIVQHDGVWHLFYTAKPFPKKGEFPAELGYATASDLSGLSSAKHVKMEPYLGGRMIAPQVFYFEPQKLWYLIGHIKEGRELKPVYSTNQDIARLDGWSQMTLLETNRKDKARVWIDFWVICDDHKAHLFYSDHTDVLYRMECPLETFPAGFASASEEVALKQSGTNAKGAWNFHEAAHIYRVKSDGRYLALLEGGYGHPVRRNLMEARDARDRFMFAMVADRLEGPWQRVERDDGIFAAEADRIFNQDGSKVTVYTQVSHPEILRAGSDQKLEVEDYRFRLLFQGFDGSKLDDGYNYNDLPWELGIMENR